MEETSSLTITDPADASSTAPAIASVDSGPVLAYAKLEGQEYCYYIRTLQVTLGRQVAKPDSVDIPLGNARSVSRHHARLFYNFATQRFELMVFGKNGAFVNERFVEKGVTVPLENRTKIKIGGSTFLFLLPRIKGIEHQHQQRPPMRVPSELNTSQDRKGDGAGGEKEIKPPVSYATLIAQAISSTQDKRMALHDIYNYIANNYPYYKVTQSDWQNSIRHNLSLNKAFVKVPRNDAQPGKGGFWAIDPTADMDFHFSIANNYMINNSANPHKRAICTSSGDEVGDKSTEDTTSDITKASSSSSNNKSSERKRSKKEHRSASSSSSSSSSDIASKAAMAEVSTSIVQQEEQSPSPPPSAAAVPPPQPISFSQQQASQTEISAAAAAATTTTAAAAASQTQIQMQLQTTIRQHLLDPVRNPLPPSIAQLLPHAIAQLPPHLAVQFSSTLQSALRAHQQTSQGPTTPVVPGSAATSNDATPTSITSGDDDDATTTANIASPAFSSLPPQQQSPSKP